MNVNFKIAICLFTLFISLCSLSAVSAYDIEDMNNNFEMDSYNNSIYHNFNTYDNNTISNTDNLNNKSNTLSNIHILTILLKN